MADIVNDLLSSYADAFKENMTQIREGFKWTTEGFIKETAKKPERKQEQIDKNELLRAYVEEDKKIQEIFEKRKKQEQELFNIKVKNAEFSKNESLKSSESLLDSYKKAYDKMFSIDKSFYAKKNEEAAKIFQTALNQNRELTDDEIKLLLNIEKEKEKASKKDLKNRINTINEVAKVEDKVRQESEIKTKARLQGVGNWFEKFIERTLNFGIDKFIFDRAINGINNFSSNYEQNFTEIAGRTGSDSRRGNHNFITGTLDNIMSSDALRHGLNFNKDVFPEITNAVKNGFIGEEAQSIAITNAVDKKIMPWLDTSSDTWVQMQYQLSEDSLKQIKGQQLLLQETREGNRILQQGVVSQLQDALLPTLQSIDANGTNEENMGAAYEYVEQLMESGMLKSDAVAYVKKLINAEQHTFDALTSSDTSSILMGLGSLNGGGIVGAQNMVNSTFGSMLSSTGNDTFGEIARGAIANTFNVKLPSDDAYYKNIYDLQFTGKYNGNNSSIYNNKVNNLREYVTATQDYDNNAENIATNMFDGWAMFPHGMEMAEQLIKEVQSISKLLTQWIGMKAGELLTKGLGKLFGNGSESNLLKTIGESKAIETLGSKLGGGLLPGASKAPFAGKLGFMSSGTGAIVGTAVGVTGGALLAYDGVKSIGQANETLSKGDTTDVEKSGARGDQILGGIEAGAGIAGAGAILALGASNPIGWAALAVGGIAFLGKAAWDNAHALSGNAKEVHSAFDEIKNTLAQENTERLNFVADLKRHVDKAKSDQEELDAIVNSGIISENEAKNMNQKALKDLTNAYVEGSKSISKASTQLLNKMEQQNTDEQDQQQKEFLYEIQDSFDAQKSAGRGGTLLTEDETNMMATLMSGVTDKDLIDKYNRHLASSGGLTYAEAIDIINGGADNWFDDTSMLDRGLDVEAMKRAQTLYGYGKNIEFNKFDKDLQLELIEQYRNIFGAYSSWKAATENESKQYFKNQVIELYNELYSNDVYKEAIQHKYNGQDSTIKSDLNKIAKDLGLNQFLLGSSYIPYDMIARLHEGERVLTAEQNRKYNENMIDLSGNSGIIEAGISDLIAAIQEQTKNIIEYLSTIGTNTFSYSDSTMNMLPSMGNTRVIY